MAKKNAGGRTKKAPRFPLNPLARFPKLLSIKQHLASLEKLAEPIAIGTKGHSSMYEFLIKTRDLITDCEHATRDMTEEEFVKTEIELSRWDTVFAKDGRLSAKDHQKLTSWVNEKGVRGAAEEFRRTDAGLKMFGVAEPEEVFHARASYLPPLCITWMYAAARFLPPFADDEPTEERFALYRHLDEAITPAALLAISKIPCVSDVADCLEERCANLFLLLCAVFLEQIPLSEQEKGAYWTVRFKAGCRKKFRALLREDFSEFFGCWDSNNFADAERLVYTVRNEREDDSCLDIRDRYDLKQAKLLDHVWMTTALCFSVWTVKKFGEFGRVRPAEDMGDLEFSFVTVHRWLLDAIDDIRILLAGLDPRRQLSSVSWLFRENDAARALSADATPEACEVFLSKDGAIARFLRLIAEHTDGQTEDDANYILSLLRACLYQDAAPPALFQAITNEAEIAEDSDVVPLLGWDSIRRNFAELCYVNTELSYGNGWHPVPPFDVLNAVCYAVACLSRPSGGFPSSKSEGKLPCSLQLPGGVYDFAALVCGLLEQYSFSVLRDERKVHRQLPAVTAAKRMLGEEELTALREELARTQSALADARAAATFSAGEVVTSLQTRVDAYERDFTKLTKENASLSNEVSRLKERLSEVTSAFDALLESLREPSEEAAALSKEALSARLSNLSFAFVGGHIQRLQELRDLGIVPKITVSATHQPKLSTVDAVVVFSNWTSHKDYHAGENVRAACGAERVFVTGTTSTERILQQIWEGLSPALKKKCEERL